MIIESFDKLEGKSNKVFSNKLAFNVTIWSPNDSCKKSYIFHILFSLACNPMHMYEYT